MLKTQLEKTLFHDMAGLVVDGEPVPLPTPLPWYPDGLAYRVDVSRKFIRQSAACQRFHTFLVTESEQGNISRQEAVSMIPPLLMAVEPHHKVMDSGWRGGRPAPHPHPRPRRRCRQILDMCAAPGSKSAQLIELLHARGDAVPSASGPGGAEAGPSIANQPQPPAAAAAAAHVRAAGFVVANDSDARRAYLLTHQTKRLQSPSFMVTNVDASQYPAIRIPGPVRGGAWRLPPPLVPTTDRRGCGDWQNGALVPMQFDRILCDAPCSGDGTMRKNPLIWRQWSPGASYGLHRLQVRPAGVVFK